MITEQKRLLVLVLIGAVLIGGAVVWYVWMMLGTLSGPAVEVSLTPAGGFPAASPVPQNPIGDIGNPFAPGAGTYENPFATPAATAAPYQNPFRAL